MAKPIFYDDFSDGKFRNRTAKDPWGRYLPEWGNISSGSGGAIDINDVDASNGYLTFNGISSYINISTQNQVISNSQVFKLEFDYFQPITSTYDGYGGLGVVGTNISGGRAQYYYQLSADGHSWLTGSGLHLLGWNAPIWGPSGSNGNVWRKDAWNHVEIYRFATHEMLVLLNGQYLHNGWSNNGNPIPLGTSDAGKSNNWEIWDNPSLYRGTTSTTNNYLTSMTGISAMLGSYGSQNIALTNIKLWDDPSIVNTISRDPHISGTGVLTVYLYDTEYPIYQWNAPLRGAIAKLSNGQIRLTQAGYCSFINLPPGTYTLTSGGQGYNDGELIRYPFQSTTRSVTITANTVTTVEVGLTRSTSYNPLTGTITGTVVNQNNSPIPDFRVRTATLETVTNVNGQYTLSAIPEDKITILFSKPDYECKGIITDVIGNSTKTLDVVTYSGDIIDCLIPVIYISIE